MSSGGDREVRSGFEWGHVEGVSAIPILGEISWRRNCSSFCHFCRLCVGM